MCSLNFLESGGGWERIGKSIDGTNEKTRLKGRVMVCQYQMMPDANWSHSSRISSYMECLAHQGQHYNTPGLQLRDSAGFTPDFLRVEIQKIKYSIYTILKT